MTKAQKAKWIKALRSGKYRQGKGALHRKGRYCCLGVACEAVHGKTIGAVTGVFGMPAEVGIRGYKAFGRGLADINDRGVPFEVIAGVIDQWVETDD